MEAVLELLRGSISQVAEGALHCGNVNMNGEHELMQRPNWQLVTRLEAR